MVKKKTKKAIKWISEIMTILITLAVIGIGGYMASGTLGLPFIEALGNKVIGWVLLIGGGLNLLAMVIRLLQKM